MASAKQIAWRKKFARMSKAGAFKKKQSQSKSAKNPKTIGAKSGKSLQKRKNAEITKIERRMEIIENELLSPRATGKGTELNQRALLKEMKRLQDKVSYIQFVKYRNV